MRRPLALAVFLAASPAFAGPIGNIDPHAVSATGFPEAYLGTVSLSLAADPLYGSRFLDAFQAHLSAVTMMASPPEVRSYLEQSAGGSEGLRALREALGRRPLEPVKASALLLANALARPEQFRQVLDGMEGLKPGLGKQSARMLREAHGYGAKGLLAALRAAGDRDPKAPPLTYGPDGRIDRLFDGRTDDGPDGVVLESPVSVPPTYDGYGPDGRPRATGLTRAARP